MTNRDHAITSQSEPAPVARLTDVGLQYGKTHALDAITLNLPAGCMVGLIGPDGVGKSSLLALIAGSRRIQQGQVEVLGGNMAESVARLASELVAAHDFVGDVRRHAAHAAAAREARWRRTVEGGRARDPQTRRRVPRGMFEPDETGEFPKRLCSAEACLTGRPSGPAPACLARSGVAATTAE